MTRDHMIYAPLAHTVIQLWPAYTLAYTQPLHDFPILSSFLPFLSVPFSIARYRQVSTYSRRVLHNRQLEPGGKLEILTSASLGFPAGL